MSHIEFVFVLNLLLFLHVVAQFRNNGQQQWPVPYRYETFPPLCSSCSFGHVTARKTNCFMRKMHKIRSLFNMMSSSEIQLVINKYYLHCSGFRKKKRGRNVTANKKQRSNGNLTDLKVVNNLLTVLRTS